MKNFKRLFSSLIKACIFLFLTPSGKNIEIKNKKILIVKPEGWGDYILMRNFIFSLKQSSTYRDYSITVAGNDAWKEFASFLDSSFIDNFIWINHKLFSKNLSYRREKIIEIQTYQYEIVLYPAYWREILFGDSIAKVAHSSIKFASYGDFYAQSRLEYYLANRIYSKLFNVNNEIIFEFLRNIEFFNNLFDANKVKLAITAPLTSNHDYARFRTSGLDINVDKYVIFFVGGETAHKWSINNFKKLYDEIIKYFAIKVVFCGLNVDNQAFKDNYPNFQDDKMVNLMGKTSQIDLLKVIHYSQFIVSNETSVPHIAVAMQKETFAISNSYKCDKTSIRRTGDVNQIGRYTPYPASITNMHHVIRPKDDIAKLNESVDINLISPIQVLDFILANYFNKNELLLR